MRDIMIDTETMGMPPFAVITQIGLRRFDRLTGELGAGICVNIQIQSCIDYGLDVTGSSIKFWLEQPGRSFLESPLSLPKGLSLVSEFVRKKDIVWSHSTFDMTVLQGAYIAVGQGVPYSYKNVRDIRTLVDLSGIKREKKEEGDEATHNALEDCDRQVAYCVPMLRKLQGGAE
jgi:hypothetical protein